MLKTLLAKIGFGQRKAPSGPSHVDDTDHPAPAIIDWAPRHSGDDLTCEHLVRLADYFKARGAEGLIHERRPTTSVTNGNIFGIGLKASTRVAGLDLGPWPLQDREVLRIRLENFYGDVINLAAFRLGYVDYRYVGVVVDCDRRSFAILTDNLDDGPRIYRDLGIGWTGEPKAQGNGGYGITNPATFIAALC